MVRKGRELMAKKAAAASKTRRSSEPEELVALVKNCLSIIDKPRPAGEVIRHALT
jgi:hypothetical protein